MRKRSGARITSSISDPAQARVAEVLADEKRRMHVSYVQPLAHAEGMLLVYLPNERMVIEADLFDPPGTGKPTAENKALFDHVRKLGVAVDTIVPIHGRPVAWSSFVSMFSR